MLGAILDFNPRSHERSDNPLPTVLSDGLISIHAPTRGATATSVFLLSITSYFNPRSHERSDICTACLSLSANISIHAPTRGATWVAVKFAPINCISIHAPTRGATYPWTAPAFLLFEFQSTLPREERLSLVKVFPYLFLFQSTLPREERLLYVVFISVYCDFNPRSHERSDNVPS